MVFVSHLNQAWSRSFDDQSGLLDRSTGTLVEQKESAGC